MDTELSLYHWSSLQRVEEGVWSSQSILWHTTNKHFSCYFKLDFLSDKAKADDGSNLKLQTGSTLKCKSVQQWLSAQIHFTFTITNCDVNGTWINVFEIF